MCTSADSIGNGGFDHANAPPSSHITTAELLTFFRNEFDFDAKETVAIMGVHNLGHMVEQNSGFRGTWVQGFRDLSTEFFRFLIDQRDERPLPSPLYVQRDRSSGGFSWMRTRLPRFPDNGSGENDDDDVSGGHDDRIDDDALIMLNVDVALISKLENHINNVTGEADCVIRKLSDDDGLQQCPKADETFDYVLHYSKSEADWRKDFRDTMVKMAMNGNSVPASCTEGALCSLS